MTCIHCGAGIVAGDVFCEAFGATLVVDAGDAGDAAQACIACAAVVGDDGFCTQCGYRARSRRDHWVESPASWVGAVCDKGITHAKNEDAMALFAAADGLAVADRSFAVLVVCDGVTSAPASERASLAGSIAACRLLAEAQLPGGSIDDRATHWQGLLAQACAFANTEAIAIARTLGDPPDPPSCTFVASVIDGDLVATAWCGDSRAYWLADDGHGQELTTDHSLGTEMIRAGMSREQAEADPTCHTITRWLGADSLDPTPEQHTLRIDRSGWLLVCSDGMWNYASTTESLAALIAHAIRDGATTPTSIAESLAAFANVQGGRDNITVALARCEPPLP